MPTPTTAPSAEDLLIARVSALTLEQKVRLLTGADAWSLHAEPAVCLRSLVVSDGPAGVRGTSWDERESSANIPSPTALAASWDPSRVHRIGRLLAAECRRKQVDVLLAPTVNLQRSPYGGRHFEMSSEDPLLTAVVGTAYVAGLQSGGVGATVKHFVANDSETERYSADMIVDERTLREVYLQPFEAIVAGARAWAVMAAYNQTNGVTMTESPMLRDLLQQEWGFDGVTMTDWSAGRSTEGAGRGGLDLVMPGPAGPWGPALVAAARAGRVSEQAVDDKVLRVLRLAARVGALAGVDGAVSRPIRWSDAEVADELRSAAAAGFVLVRNAAAPPYNIGGGLPILPLARANLGRVAVLGPNAARGRTLGGGSALVFPPYTVSPLAGLCEALGATVHVDHAPGVRAHTRVPPADPDHLLLPDREDRGVAVLFRGADGSVLGRQERLSTAYNWQGPISGIDPALVTAIEVHTRLRTVAAGVYAIGGSGLGRFTLSVDGVEQFDVTLTLPGGVDPAEGLMRPPQHVRKLPLAADQLVDVVLTHDPDWSTASFGAPMLAFQLNAEAPRESDDAALERAVVLAASADVAVVVVGTTEEVESEGFDRDTLALPGRQDELVRRVAAVNRRTVVVVNSGSPVLLPWRDEVSAILLSWFPGQEFGTALADVLLGVVEPGGRLPTSWPADEDAPLPSTRPRNGKRAYTEGVHLGYRRFLRDAVQPAYWFGHGLGYTSWTYGEPTVSASWTGGADITVPITNTGKRPGRQVVQIYAAKPASAVERPVRWLAGFAAVESAPGEHSLLSIPINSRSFQHWDVATHSWALEPGPFELHVGRSADDLVASVSFGPRPWTRGTRVT